MRRPGPRLVTPRGVADPGGRPGPLSPWPIETPLLRAPGDVPWQKWFSTLVTVVNAALVGGGDADTLDGLDSTDFLQKPMPVADLPAHHVTHEPGGSDALTALSASILTTGTVPVARLGAGTFTVVTNTDTGTVTDWNPGHVGHGNTIVRWSSGVGSLMVDRLAGGVNGQLVVVKNQGNQPLFVVDSGAVNGCQNFAAGQTPLAGRGVVVYQFLVDAWHLLAHEQGGWITPPFNAALFTGSGGPVTVDAGDVETCAYLLQGTTLQLRLILNAISVGAGVSALLVTLPGGYRAAHTTYTTGPLIYDNSGSVQSPGFQNTAVGTTRLYVGRVDQAAWQPSTHNTYVYLVASVSVQ